MIIILFINFVQSHSRVYAVQWILLWYLGACLSVHMYTVCRVCGLGINGKA